MKSLRVLIFSFQPPTGFESLGLAPNADELWITAGIEHLSEIESIRYENVCRDSIPTEVGDVDMVIIPGSQYSICRLDKRPPWLLEAQDFVRLVMAKRIPLFGICFGHQLILSAMGGIVQQHKRLSFGVERIFPIEDGWEDPLFNGLNFQDYFNAAKSHLDWAPHLPQGFVPLASSEHSMHQAAMTGVCRTVQFHPEIPARDLVTMARARRAALIDAGVVREVQFDDWLAELASSTHEQAGRRILQNFVREIAYPAMS